MTPSTPGSAFAFNLEGLTLIDLYQLRENLEAPVVNGLVEADPYRCAAGLAELAVELSRREALCPILG